MTNNYLKILALAAFATAFTAYTASSPSPAYAELTLTNEQNNVFAEQKVISGTILEVGQNDMWIDSDQDLYRVTFKALEDDADAKEILTPNVRVALKGPVSYTFDAEGILPVIQADQVMVLNENITRTKAEAVLESSLTTTATARTP